MTKGNLIISGKNRLFREALKHILQGPNMAVIGETSSLREVAALLRSTVHRVDLMVCDTSENTHQDFQVLQQIGQEFPEIGIIILTNDLSRSDLNAAIAGGARAFLPKSISPAALQTALQLILLEENIFAAPASLSRGIAATPHTPIVPHRVGPRGLLSAREAQILGYLEAGQPNKVIARHLDMAEATVKVHLKALLRKINAGNRTQAAIWSLNHKLADGEFDGRS